MKRILPAITAAALLALSACGQPSTADPIEAAPVIEGTWSIDSDSSELAYVSVKQGEIAEANTFSALSGSVAEDGTAKLEIDLSSVDTGVDIRNERMRDVFFVVADNPTATVTAKLDPATFETLDVGNSLIQTVDGTVALKGVEAPFQADVMVTRPRPNTVIVSTQKPIIVEASALKLNDGLAKLQELAGLDSITPVVPVTFTLTFNR